MTSGHSNESSKEHALTPYRERECIFNTQPSSRIWVMHHCYLHNKDT